MNGFKYKIQVKIVNLVLWYYDENMKYISGPDISGNYYSKVPDNAKECDFAINR